MSPSSCRAIFLDRDGVLNNAVVRHGKPYPPASVEELSIPADVLPTLHRGKQRGYLLVGVTNQPDVARGKVTRETVELINRKLLELLPLAEIMVCYHDDRDGCSCRKPMPGLLFQAAARYAVDLSASFMIGDRWRDIEAGRRAGCRTIWIKTDYDEQWSAAPPDGTVRSLSDAFDWIISPIQDGQPLWIQKD